MFLTGFHKWAGFIVAAIVATALLCTPADAKGKSLKNSTKKNKPTAENTVEPKAEKPPKKVKIDADDPKAFTKALLLDKEGVEYEIIESKKNRRDREKQKKSPRPEPEPVGEIFDFSTMLIPITHEALVGSPYGIRSHRLHRGVDVNVIKDEPVVAAYPGEVTMSRYNKGGYGNYVLIRHPNGLQTLYAHLSKRLLKVGDEVFPGDIVGLAGNSGRSSAAHLHFEIRYGEVNIDPCTVIDFPHWALKDGVESFSMKKAVAAHRKIQTKLKKNNFYIVKKGDSQGDVANWFNISIESLCRINNLKPGAPLKAGQKLFGSR